MDLDNTNAVFFTNPSLKHYGIDIYGNFAGSKASLLAEGFSGLNGRVRYYGYLENDMLKQLRPYYAYGIVMWAPVNENQYYAAPNKFFEYIADGVVPICTPHPQCKKIIEKYKCGLLFSDWSYESFYKRLRLQ